MKRNLFAVALVAMVAGLAPAQDDAAKKAAKELEGTYSLKAMTRGGKAPPEEFLKSMKEFVIKGDQIVAVKADGKEDPIGFKLDPSAKPSAIDMLPPKDKTNEKLKPGIYKLEKGELTIVFGIEKESARPTDFKGDGADQMMMVLVKKK